MEARLKSDELSQRAKRPADFEYVTGQNHKSTLATYFPASGLTRSWRAMNLRLQLAKGVGSSEWRDVGGDEGELTTLAIKLAAGYPVNTGGGCTGLRVERGLG
jgi:hypothetical protein